MVQTVQAERPQLPVHGIEPNGPPATAAQPADSPWRRDVPDAAAGLGTFDSVVFSDVLEHLIDPSAN